MSKNIKKINSKQKGKKGELELSKYLTEKGFVSRRGCQFKGGKDSPDIITSDFPIPVHIECKRTERFKLEDSLNQAIKDAGENKIPIVIHRKNRSEWVAVLKLDNLLDIMDLIKNNNQNNIL
jgi:Holliday junction resolvase